MAGLERNRFHRRLMSTILKAYGVVLAFQSCCPGEPIMIRTVPVTAGLISFTLLFAGCGGGGGSDGSSEPQPDLSGAIDIESGTRVDSDTADDRRVDLATANDTAVSAQTLPSGATVGGYLSSGSDTYTNFFQYFEDAVDVYAVDLSPGDRVAFQVFSSPEDLLPAGAAAPERSLRILRQQAGTVVEVASQSASGDMRPLVAASV